MRRRHFASAFTIVELLVAAAITVVIVVLLGSMFGSLMSTASRANERSDSFRDARAALQMMSRDLSGVVRTTWNATTPPVPVTRPSAYFALDDLYADPTSGKSAATNQQVYALITAKNAGQGDVCAVGYYCRWNPTQHTYSLHRFFADSATTFGRLASTPTYVADTVLYTPSTADDVLASYVWNLRITAFDAAGTVIATYPYVCDSSAAAPATLPASLEISFSAISPEAARAVLAAQPAATVWMDNGDSTHQRLIAPHTYEFRSRIKL